MGIRESLLNTITSVADSDFVRIVTSAGASSKATVRNLFKGFESNLSAKSSLTTSDYIRVVGSDNEAYKQSISNVKSVMGVDTLSSNLTSLSNAVQGFRTYNDTLFVEWSDCSYTGIRNNIKSIVEPGLTYRNKWVSIRVNNTGASVDPFGTSSFSVLFNCSSTSYGWCMLHSDSPRTGFIVGRLAGGTWDWQNLGDVTSNARHDTNSYCDMFIKPSNQSGYPNTTLELRPQKSGDKNLLQIYVNGVDYGYILFDVSRNVGVIA